MRSWTGDERYHTTVIPEPRRFSWWSAGVGASLATFVIAGTQWLYSHDAQWGFAALGALFALPAFLVLGD